MMFCHSYTLRCLLSGERVSIPDAIPSWGYISLHTHTHNAACSRVLHSLSNVPESRVLLYIKWKLTFCWCGSSLALEAC